METFFHLGKFINIKLSLKILPWAFPMCGGVVVVTLLCLWRPAWEQRKEPDASYALKPGPKTYSREDSPVVHHRFVTLNSPKARDQYEKGLEEVTSYTPRYMEEMEAIFEQSQEEERKRISFLKQVFLSIHRHLDITNNERCLYLRPKINFILKSSGPITVPCVLSVKAVYSELHQTLMSIDEEDDLKWWKNNLGPGMPTDWPKIEVFKEF